MATLATVNYSEPNSASPSSPLLPSHNNSSSPTKVALPIISQASQPPKVEPNWFSKIGYGVPILGGLAQITLAVGIICPAKIAYCLIFGVSLHILKGLLYLLIAGGYFLKSFFTNDKEAKPQSSHFAKKAMIAWSWAFNYLIKSILCSFLLLATGCIFGLASETVTQEVGDYKIWKIFWKIFCNDTQANAANDLPFFDYSPLSSRYWDLACYTIFKNAFAGNQECQTMHLDPWKGIDYVVRDPSQGGKVVGYLIGTIHIAPKKFVPTKEYALLDSCQEFISEIDIQELEIQEPSRKNAPYIAIDKLLYKHAREKNIPTFALETIDFQKQLSGKPIKSSSSNIWGILQLWEILRKGNENVFTMQDLQDFGYKRNQTWALGGENTLIKEGLIARLRKTSAPICITVGFFHLCLGIENNTRPTTLVQMLRAADFLVEQI